MVITTDFLLEYSADQEKALDSIVEFLNTGKPGIFRLTGAASVGVGKSRITEEILAQLDEDNEPYVCTALTNAAAAVLKAAVTDRTDILRNDIPRFPEIPEIVSIIRPSHPGGSIQGRSTPDGLKRVDSTLDSNVWLYAKSP